MAQAEDVQLVVEKLKAVRAQGEGCMGMVYGKTGAEWMDIFNAAAQHIGVPLVEVEDVASPADADIEACLDRFSAAFEQTGGAETLIVTRASGQVPLSMEQSCYIANGIEELAQKFSKAIYVQIVTDPRFQGQCEDVNLYCMQPFQPRDPSEPIMPV
ncbi:MAG: hypothetical protein LRY36_00790 [Alphaproteobacteria bacterium]|nr:hypothetical protein [Alphaproteobacteria bacterium]